MCRSAWVHVGQKFSLTNKTRLRWKLYFHRLILPIYQMLLPFKFCVPRELGSCKMPSAYQLLLCTLSWRQQVISTCRFRPNNDRTKLFGAFWQHFRPLVLYVALYNGINLHLDLQLLFFNIKICFFWRAKRHFCFSPFYFMPETLKWFNFLNWNILHLALHWFQLSILKLALTIQE